MTSLISSTSWVPRGFAASQPKRYTLDEREIDRVAKLAGNRLQQVKEDLLNAQLEDEGEAIDIEEMVGGEDAEDDRSQKSEPDLSHVAKSRENSEDADQEWTDEEKSDVEMKTAENLNQKVDRMTDDLAVYNLDNYDNEKSKGVSMGAFSNVKGLQYYANPSEDPHITLNDLADEDVEERDELQVYPTDNFLVAAKTEDDVSQLEVYVFDESQENLYIHHDLLLPALPLCLEWINFTPANALCSDPARQGNFLAVGTMDPDIEIWSLDVIDGLYPDAILGESSSKTSPDVGIDTNDQALQDLANENISYSTKSKKKKKKKKKDQPLSKSKSVLPTSDTHHTSSVLSLSHNKNVRNLLLSSSADTTIKLWDMSRSPSASANFSAIRSFDLHQDKVQCALWNPKEPSVVLSGGWDSMVKVWDSRSSSEGVQVRVDSDVECLRWNPFQPHSFLVSFDNGHLQSYDSRNLPKFTTATPDQTKALWTLSAHDSSVSAMDISSVIPGLLITGGVDRKTKVWNIDNQDSSPRLSMVVSRDLDVGKVFSVAFSPDSPTIVAAAGSNANLQIWDIATNSGVRTVFAERLKTYANINPENCKVLGNGGVLCLDNDDESDGSDDPGS